MIDVHDQIILFNIFKRKVYVYDCYMHNLGMIAHNALNLRHHKERGR